MDMPLNVEVYCTDGVCGRSKDVVVDRKSEEVTHLVVKEKHAPHTEILVPVHLVAETTPHQIRLRCTQEKLAELQPFLNIELVEEKIPRYIAGPYLMPVELPDTKWVAVKRESIPTGELAVRQGARVEATDGHIGRLDEFIVDPTNEHVTHLVLREGHLWGQKDVTIPVSEIERLEKDAVYLKLSKRQVEALPAIPIGMR